MFLAGVHYFFQLELVKETIAYITYLESVLQRAPPADKVRVRVLPRECIWRAPVTGFTM